MPDGTYEVRGFDSFGDGWNGGNINFDFSGASVLFSTGPPNAGYAPSPNSCNGVASSVSGAGAAILGTFTIGTVSCVITCPANIVVDNDPGTCEAYVNVPLPITDLCVGPAINDYNGTSNASDIYPIGETVVLWSAPDELGIDIECEMTITVINTEAIELNCPDDIELTLDPGDCDAYPLWATPIAFSCNGFGAPPATVMTTTAGGNANASGGMVWFDVTNNFSSDMGIVGMSANIGGPTMINIYIKDGSYVGFNTNPAAWTLVYTADATTGPFSGPFPGNGTLTPFVTDFAIPAGTSGIALHMISTNSNYTNGNGANQFYTDGNLDISLGYTANAAWANGFTPRVWNGSITYGTLENTTEAVQTSGPASGEPFPIGTTTVTYTATDVDGNTAECSFDVTVNNYPNPTGTLACNDNVQISVDEECIALINADMILEGGPYSCYDDYEVRIYDYMPTAPFNVPGNISNPVPLGNYVVGIFDETGNNCWSTITVLDKLNPILECRDVSVSCEDGAGSVDEPAPGMVGYQDIVYDGLNDVVDQNSFDYVFDFSYLPAGLPVLDANMRLMLTGHTWLPDLNVIVTAPDGTTGSIFTIGGCVGQDWDIDLLLDDDGATITQCVDLNCGGCATQPFAAGVANPFLLQVFEGVEASGVWTITISDNFAGDDGIIEIVGLSIEVNAPQVVPYDACGPIDLSYTDNTTFNYCESVAQDVVRTWTAVDESGNFTQCVQHISVTAAVITDMAWPVNWDGLVNHNPMLECDGTYPLNASGYPDPEYTGWPANGSDYCGTLEVFYNDQVYTVADGVPCGIKILRYWTLVDDCTGDIYEHIQVIRVTDTTAPAFMLGDDIVAKTKAYECNSNIEVPAIMHLEDNCDSYPQWWVTTTAGVLIGDDNFNGFVDAWETWSLLNVPMGTYELCYYAVDNCDNVVEGCVAMTVFDGVPPIPVCEQYKQVSLTAMGTSMVWAKDFDSGSFDNCAPIAFKVLRVNGDLEYDGGCENLNGDDKPSTSTNDVWYDDEVFFCCEDVDPNQDIMVSLRVFDVDPGVGPVDPSRYDPGKDLYGHYNDCWSIVHLECKIPPVMDCPPVEVTCEESIDPEENPRLMPDIISVCGFTAEYEDKRDLGVCGASITRTWSVTGCDLPTSCKQKITITTTEDFDPCTIKFPRDVQTDCSKDLSDGKEPTWDENPCNIVTAEVIHEDTFTFVDGACYKIVREWAVIDWCVYEPNTGAEDNVDEISGTKLNCSQLVVDGYYRYTQILMVTDLIPPTITLDDQCVATTDCYAYEVEMTATAADSCNTDQKFWWKYIVTNMDTWETVQYSYNYVPEPSQGTEGKRSSDDLDKVTEGKLEILDPLPMGNYRVTWTVGDGCGNANSMNQYFEVADKKAPTPIMVDIATAVMVNGMVELNARTFDKGGCDFGCLSSVDNCTEKPGLYFTFTDQIPNLWDDPLKWEKQLAKYGKYFFDPNSGAISTEAAYFGGTAHAWLPEGNTSRKAFICDGYDPDVTTTVTIKIYVWDQFAYDEDCDDSNFDYANVLLTLKGCTGGTNAFPVGGMVSTVSGDEFEGMVMTADNGETVVSTVSAGTYEFSLVADEYELGGASDGNYLNGVTTLDLVIIQKHLLGLSTLTDGYQLLAADANNNGSIAASDLLEIRKVILGSSDRFTNNSWVAVNPDNYSRTINVNVTEATLDNNFTVIKIGDLNNSANVDLVSRNSNSVNMMIDDVNMEEGQLVEVPFYANDFTNVYGAQFTMNVSSLNVEGITAGTLNVSSSNMNVVNNNLVMSWNNAQGVSVTEGDVLFTLTLRATSTTNLSSVLNINDNIARSEAYRGSDLEISKITLEYRNSEVSYTLYQNEPNPFTEITVIGFDLPETSEYTLTVYDVTGKVVKVYNAEGTAGYNAQTLDKKDVNVSGVLYYRLESGDYTATKKMIMIK